MAEETLTLENVNAMPAPTWGWLRMNSATVELPAGLTKAPAAAVEVTGAEGILGTPEDFAAALAAVDARYPQRRAAAPGDAADRERSANEDEALDVPALSAYQKRAVHLEEECGPAASFAHATGKAAVNYLEQAGGEPVVLNVPAYGKAAVTVRVNGTDGAAAVGHIQVAAGAQAQLDLTIALDSPTAGTGVVGSLLSVVAGAYARVDVTCVQTLDDSWIALDSSAFCLDEGARVNVQHTVLGGGASFTGLAGELYGDLSKMTVDTDYLGAREQKRDFNYSLRHLGRKTESNMDANGVLTGSAKKVLRGTIDLVHGCKGSEGTERETVLLANKGVDNKTVPVILCDEDDVAGNHGATIGHVRDEQLFYLACRGLDQEAGENLFIRAKLEDAALAAPDDQVRAGVIRLGNQLVSDFEEEIA